MLNTELEHKRILSLRGRCALWSIIALLYVATANVRADTSKQHHFNITQSTLGNALETFALQAKVQLLYPYDLATNTDIHPVVGQYTVIEALNIMLRDTNFSTGLTKRGIVTISHLSSQQLKKPGNFMKNTNTNKKSLAVALAMAMSTQTINTIAEEETTKEEDSATVETIVITARKRAESIQDVPIAISAFSGDNLTRQGLTNISEIGDLTPNMEFDSISPINGSSNTPNINIRGIGTTDFLLTIDPSVGVYLDGVYVARSVGGLFDLLDVERVEVLRGPQGTLFGRNTIGGAVQIISKKPDDAFHYMAEATTGTDSRRDFRASLSGALSEDLFASFSLSSKQRDGYGKRLNYYDDHPELQAPIEAITLFNEPGGYAGIGAQPDSGEQPGNENKRAARLNLVYAPSEDFTLSFSADYSTADETAPALILMDVFLDDLSAPTPGVANPMTGNEFAPNIVALHHMFGFADGTIPYDDRFIVGDNYSTYASGPGASESDIWGVSLVMDWQLDNDMNFKSITAQRDLDSIFGQDPDHSPFVLDAHTNDYEHSQFSQEFQLGGLAMEDKLKWLLGAYYFQEDGIDRVIVPLLHGLVLLDQANEIDNSAWAVFGQATYDFTPKTSLTFGVRYTDEHKKYIATHLDRGPANALGSEIVMADGTFVLLVGEGENDFTNTSPYLSLSHRWDEDMLTYASYSKGFKSGGFTGRTTAFIADQKPIPFNEEEAATFEVGFKSSLLDKRVRFNGAFFTTDYDDLQVTVQEGVAPITDNAGKARINGAEFELSAVVTEDLRFNAAVGLLDATYKEKPSQLGDHLVNTPDSTANLGFEYYTAQLSNGYDLVIRGNYTHKSKVYNNAENTALLTQDAVGLLNASLTLESNNDQGWSFTLGGKNLTDETYLVTGFFQPGVGYTEGVFARGSEWYLSAKIDY